MKRILLLIVLSMLPRMSIGQYLGWAHVFEKSPAPASATPEDIATDNSGNCIVSGQFNGVSDFDLDTTAQMLLTSVSAKDLFLAKYNPAGTIQWVKQFSPTTANSFYIFNVSCDHANNIIIWGVISDTIDIDPGAGTNTFFNTATGGDYYIAKLDQDGNLLWATTTQLSTSKMVPASVVVGPDNDVYLCGTFRDTIDFDFGAGVAMDTASTQLVNADGFLVKMDPAGNYLWHKVFNGYLIPYMRDIAFDSQKRVYVCGSFDFTVDFDPGPAQHYLSSQGADDGFVVILDENGIFVKVMRVGKCTSDDFVLNILLDENDFIYMLGVWDNTMDFDNGPGAYNISAVSNNDYYLAKMDINGNILWANKVGTNINGFDVVIPNKITYDLVNELLLTGRFTITNDFDPTPASSHIYTVTNSMGDGYIQNIDVNGNFKGLNIISSTSNDGYKSAAVTSSGTIYTVGNFYFSVDFDPGPAQYILTSSATTSYFLQSLNANANFATGKVYRDMNLNAIYDSGDYPLQNCLVHCSSGNNFMTNSSGNYMAYFDSGNVSLSYNNLPPLASAVPSFYSISNSNYNNTDVGKDFAVQVPAGTNNASVLLTNLNLTRTGRNSYVDLTYVNNGTNPLSGSIKFVYDPKLNYVNSSIAPSSTSSDTIWWNYSNLLPLESRTIHINFVVQTSAIIGDMLQSNVLLTSTTGDDFPADNVDTLYQYVIASFDPNDKQVIPATGLTTQQVANGDYLEYIIRFQNTGNDTAFTVQLVDTLSALLDVSSFEIQASSHPFFAQLAGGNIMRFVFNNILLPDSTTDEAGSHGYIRYRIKPLNSVTAGNVIENTAHIYFDFNAPVATNTTATIINNVSAISSITETGVFIYPNPVSAGGQLKLIAIPGENIQISLFSLTGEKVFDRRILFGNGVNIIQIPVIAAGIYNCFLESEEYRSVIKLAIME